MEIVTVAPFLPYFENVRGRTLRLVRCIPPEQLEWRAAAGKFTLGDVARHIAATERSVFAECVAGGHSRYSGCGPELASGHQAVIAYMERMHRESMDIFARLNDADLQRKCESPDGSPIMTWKLLRAMVEHEVHHRGELYAYLGILGIEVPPLYGVTSEKLRELASIR